MTDTVSSGPERAGRPEWIGPLAMMTLVQIAATMSVLALTSLAPEVAGSLGIGAHAIGYQISLIYFAGVFASAIAGSVVETFHAERVIVTELGVFAAGLLLLATGRPVLMVLASALFGICYGLNNPASSEILHRAARGGRHSLVFSIKQTGVPFGAVLASTLLPMLAVALPGTGAGWRHALVAAAVVPLVLMVWAWSQFTFPPIRMAAWRGNPFARAIRDQVELYRNRRMRTLALLGGLYSALQLMVTAFAVVMMVEHGWPLVAAGIVAACLQMAGAAGRISWGLAADRLGGFRTLGIIGVIAGLCMFLLGWAGALPGWALAVLLVVLGAVATGWNGVFLAAAARTAPSGKVGANTGALLVYTFIGVIIGPSAFALIYDLTGSYDLCFMGFSCIGFAGAAMSFRQHAAQVRT